MKQKAPHFNKQSIYLVIGLFFAFFSNVTFAQSGISINWDVEVGCQTYSSSDDRKIFLEDITDGPCIRVCEGSIVTYSLNDPAGSISATTWSVAGGVINSQTPFSCTITWGNSGAGSLTFAITTATGIITKTLCFEKIIKPVALFNMAPYVSPTKYIFACSDQILYFVNLSTANSGTTIMTYSWDFGDPTSTSNYSSAENPTHTYLNEGSYFVTLTVTNACNCSTSYRRRVFVSDKGFDISCPGVVCENQQMNYSLPEDVQQICYNHYNWFTNEGTINSVNPNNGEVTVTWDHVGPSGFGSLTYIPDDCDLNCLLPSTIRIPVVTTVGTIIGDANVCVKQHAIYSLPQWPTTQFNWEVLGNVANSLAIVIPSEQRNEVAVITQVPGTMILRCTYTNTLLGCGGTAEFVINASRPIDFTGDFVVCQNTTGNYTSNGVNTTWTLKNSTGTTLPPVVTSSSTFSYNFTVAGGYTLSTGTSGTCPEQVKNITVVPAPSPVLAADIKVQLSNGNLVPATSLEICPNATYTYSLPEDLATQYHWSVTNGNINGSTTGNQISVSFTGTGPAQLTVYKESLTPMVCPSVPVTIAIPIKIIRLQINGNTNESACANSNTSMYNANIFGGSTLYTEGETYTWSITPASLGSITSGQGTPTINVTWNNVTAASGNQATLTLVVQKCTIVTTTTVSPSSCTPIVVTLTPTPTITITPSVTTICSGVPVTYTVTSITSGITLNSSNTVTWAFNGVPDPSQTGLTATHTFYNISGAPVNPNTTAVISGPNGCTGVTNTASVAIQVNPEPTATCSITSTTGNVFCNAWDITTELGSATATGATIQWYYVNPSNVTTAIAAPDGQAPNLYCSLYGFGGYYFIATKNGCTSRSNTIGVSQFCGPPVTCNVVPYPTVENNATNGCQPPSTTVPCSTCDRLNLEGNAPGALASPPPSWIVIGPTNYSGNASAGLTIPAQVGVYNTLYNAVYLCTNGDTSLITIPKNITVPYLSDFDYTKTCNNNTSFNLTFTDKSSYYFDVDPASVTYKYYYKLHSNPIWPTTPFANTANAALTLNPGQWDVKLVIQGVLSSTGMLQTPCEKIYFVPLLAVPAQSISFAPALCHDTAVNFSITNPQSGDSYFWMFEPTTANEASNTLLNPSRVFPTSGIKVVTVKITNRFGCDRILSTTTTSGSPTTVTIPAKCFNGNVSSPLTTVCAGSPVTINYVPNGDTCPVAQYIWMNGQDVIASAPNAASIMVYTPGFYWVKVVSGSNCIHETPGRITPTFKTPPSIRLDAPAATCLGNNVTIKAISNATVLRWKVDNVPQPGYNDLTTVIFSGLALGTHTFVVTAYSGPTNDPATCSAIATQTVAIVAAPDVPVITQEIFCQGQDPYHVVLTATSNVPGVFNWSNGMSGSTITVTNGGPYQVRVTNGGCSSKAQTDVPKNPEDYIWVFPSGCQTACRPENPFATLIGPLLPLPYWEWQFEDNTALYGVDTFPSPFNLAGNGTYNLQLFTSENCNIISEPLTFSSIGCSKCDIDDVDLKDISYTGERYCSFSIILEIDANTTLQSTLVAPNNEVIIDSSGFLINSGVFTYTFNIFPIGNFVGGPVLLQINSFQNGAPCIYEFYITIPSCIQSNEKQAGSMTNIVTPSHIVLFPNPAKEQVTVRYNELPTDAVVELYDLTGRTIAAYTVNNQKGDLVVPTSSYPKGIYLVVVRSANGLISQHKLVIE
jgi:PKD repeat protein